MVGGGMTVWRVRPEGWLARKEEGRSRRPEEKEEGRRGGAAGHEEEKGQ
jgi:hypothetical protein